MYRSRSTTLSDNPVLHPEPAKLLLVVMTNVVPLPVSKRQKPTTRRSVWSLNIEVLFQIIRYKYVLTFSGVCKRERTPVIDNCYLFVIVYLFTIAGARYVWGWVWIMINNALNLKQVSELTGWSEPTFERTVCNH